MLKCNKLDYLSLDINAIRCDTYGRLAECMMTLANFPGASHCLVPLKKFVSRGIYDKDIIFKSLIQYCRNIDEMIIEDSDATEGDSLVDLITSQRKLCKFTIGNWWGCLLKILKSLGDQRNSLTYIEIYGCHFRSDFVNDIIFDGVICCKNLETLKIEECYNLTSNIMKPLATTIFPKLHTLYFSNYLLMEDIEDFNDQGMIPNNDQDRDHPHLELIAIIQNANLTLRDVRLNMDLLDYPDIITICATNCPNITHYKARIQNHSEMYQLLQLLKSCTRLEKLEITAEKWECSDLGLPWEIDLFFPELGKSLPKTLKCLDIDGWSCTPLGLSNFLKNCNVDIKRMSWMCYISSAGYLEVIEKYAKLKGRTINRHKEKKKWGLNFTLTVDFD
ncbi:3951_t:CDS:1 [Funneliformis mosseae]|uniref:3951_t:CDS:1 n=1 Tax=Funneliformis mosseae TaxID=27381 RepID=A0A9N8UZ56_FUNMO|nr:3951_t:CDS:1 [Funneliformis mosseae]